MEMEAETPRIIEDFPGKAVEEYRLRHHGFLPSEELQWIDSLTMAIKANLGSKITEAELDELKALAIAGNCAESALTAKDQELARMRANDERYRWLRDNIPVHLHGDVDEHGARHFHAGKSLDARIDTALSEEGNG